MSRASWCDGLLTDFVVALLGKPRAADEPFCTACCRAAEVVSRDTFGDYSLCGRCHKSVRSSDQAFRVQHGEKS